MNLAVYHSVVKVPNRPELLAVVVEGPSFSGRYRIAYSDPGDGHMKHEWWDGPTLEVVPDKTPQDIGFTNIPRPRGFLE